jgi:hypothetical protein
MGGSDNGHHLPDDTALLRESNLIIALFIKEKHSTDEAMSVEILYGALGRMGWFDLVSVPGPFCQNLT